MTIRAIHVVPGTSRESSGPSYSVVNLCRWLRETGIDTTLCDLEDSDGDPKPDFVKSFPAARFPARLGRSPQMRLWLARTARAGGVDIVHNHSLWMMPNVYACNAVKGTGIPLVVSPRGTLSAWAMGSGSRVKKVFWPLVQRPALASVSCFHATAESEFEDIRRQGFTQPVTIIPNGIDLPQPGADSVTQPPAGHRTLLFLGRIHPIKGLDLLLPAWAALQDRFSDWRLRIVGPDNRGHLDDMKKLAAKLGLERVEFCGPLYGREKTSAYLEAELFVLPSYSENFGMAVAEALAAGTPAVVSRAAPWAGLQTHNAGWWVDTDANSLEQCLQQALALPGEELASLGQNGRRWMAEAYSWESCAQKMRETYDWLLGKSAMPGCVRL